jgi:microcompartment protein CcmK/EutM
MFVAKVTGAVVSTQKAASMVGFKLLVVEPYRVEANDPRRLATTGRTLIAVDTLGAGPDDYVLVTQGSSARLTPETKNLPIDTVIVGIIDQVHVQGDCVYARQDEGKPNK